MFIFNIKISLIQLDKIFINEYQLYINFQIFYILNRIVYYIILLLLIWYFKLNIKYENKLLLMVFKTIKINICTTIYLKKYICVNFLKWKNLVIIKFLKQIDKFINKMYNFFSFLNKITNFRMYTSKFFNYYDFQYKWFELEKILIKHIKKNIWPKIYKNQNIFFITVCKYLSKLSLIGKDTSCIVSIGLYSFSCLIKCLSINKIKKQGGLIPGKDYIILLTNTDKIALYKQISNGMYFKRKWINLTILEIEMKFHKITSFFINIVLDRILQTQLCLLLDTFYESKYNFLIYGFRKGRFSLQVVGLLKQLLDGTNKDKLGLSLIDMDQILNTISHRIILKLLKLPHFWKTILKSWLRLKEWGFNSIFLGYRFCGIIKGSIIGSLIYNVLILYVIYKNQKEELNIFMYECLKKYIFKHTFKIKIQRSIFNYIDKFVIFTTNCSELMFLVKIFQYSLGFLCMYLFKFSNELIYYINLNINQIKYNYLGFTFLYFSLRYIKIKKVNFFKSKVKNYIFFGKHLVYPSREVFNKIKQKLKFIILKLKRLTVVQVVYLLNFVLKSWVFYFGWSCSYKRLLFLTYYVYKNFKTELINKFKYRGLKRIKWVMSNFVICKTLTFKNALLYSPDNLKWHLHAFLYLNRKQYLKKTVFIIIPIKVFKILPITQNCLSKKCKYVPYYLNENIYLQYILNLIKIRLIKLTYKHLLLIKQQGLCFECGSIIYLDLYKILNFESLFQLDELVIYYIKPVLKIFGKYDKIHTLLLVHKECFENKFYFKKS